MLRISVASTPSRASAGRPRAPLLGGAEIALDAAESLFEERLAAGDLDVLDRAEALLQQVQLLLIQLRAPTRRCAPTSGASARSARARAPARSRPSTSVIGGAETSSTIASASDDHRLGEDVDRRTGDQLVGDVGRARHRLDQRRRSPPRVKEVIGGKVSREQAFGGDGRRSIDGPLAQPLRPRQKRRAQHVEDADAKREHRRPARADRSPATSPTAATRPAPFAPAPDRRPAAAVRRPRARRPLRSARRDPRPARARTSASARAPAASRSPPANRESRLSRFCLSSAVFSYTPPYARPHLRFADRTISSRRRASCWSA